MANTKARFMIPLPIVTGYEYGRKRLVFFGALQFMPGCVRARRLYATAAVRQK
jgi:hypothetical protein